MSDTPKQVLMVGLPESGKSTYLGALYYLLRKGRDERLTLVEEPAERGYLQELEDKWLRFRAFERSTHPGAKPVELLLGSPSDGRFTLSMPDVTGESYSHLWEDGVWSEPVRSFAQEAEAIILFVRPNNLKQPELIDVSAGPSSGDTKWIEWEPEMAPTQAVLCDLLESIKRERGGSPARTAVVVSAWDVVRDLGVSPQQWLELQVPLLWQWLDAQEEPFEFEAFGISAQGGDVTDQATREGLAENADPLERILRGPGAHDLIDPLLWLLDR